MTDKKAKTYRGNGLNVSFDATQCSHGGNCIQSLPSVFNLQAKPWINLDGCDANEVIKTVQHCPSGALQFTEASDTSVSLSLTPDGPINIRGDLKIKAHFNDIGTQASRVSLCRCGLSKNKPYCDASHLKNFSEQGHFDQRPAAATKQAASNSMDIICVENGPLMCKGNVDIHAANGESITVIDPALCRCGASKRKPFCDGTHNKIGFNTTATDNSA